MPLIYFKDGSLLASCGYKCRLPETVSRFCWGGGFFASSLLLGLKAFGFPLVFLPFAFSSTQFGLSRKLSRTRLVASFPGGVISHSLNARNSYRVENLDLLSVRPLRPKEIELKVVGETECGYSLRRNKITVSCHLLTQKELASDDNLEPKEYGRNSTRNLNSSEDQPSELSRQGTEKRKYSTLSAGCFPGWKEDFLLTEAAQKRKEIQISSEGISL